MMKVLLVLVIVCALFCSTYAACFQEVGICEPNSTEVKNCQKCSCDAYGFMKSCCDTAFRPFVKNKSKCSITFNKKKCEYKVKPLRKKWKRACEITGYTG